MNLGGPQPEPHVPSSNSFLKSIVHDCTEVSSCGGKLPPQGLSTATGLKPNFLMNHADDSSHLPHIFPEIGKKDSALFIREFSIDGNVNILLAALRLPPVDKEYFFLNCGALVEGDSCQYLLPLIVALGKNQAVLRANNCPHLTQFVLRVSFYYLSCPSNQLKKCGLRMGPSPDLHAVELLDASVGFMRLLEGVLLCSTASHPTLTSSRNTPHPPPPPSPSKQLPPAMVIPVMPDTAVTSDLRPLRHPTPLSPSTDKPSCESSAAPPSTQSENSCHRSHRESPMVGGIGSPPSSVNPHPSQSGGGDGDPPPDSECVQRTPSANASSGQRFSNGTYHHQPQHDAEIHEPPSEHPIAAIDTTTSAYLPAIQQQHFQGRTGAPPRLFDASTRLPSTTSSVRPSSYPQQRPLPAVNPPMLLNSGDLIVPAPWRRLNVVSSTETTTLSSKRLTNSWPSTPQSCSLVATSQIPDRPTSAHEPNGREGACEFHPYDADSVISRNGESSVQPPSLSIESQTVTTVTTAAKQQSISSDSPPSPPTVSNMSTDRHNDVHGPRGNTTGGGGTVFHPVSPTVAATGATAATPTKSLSISRLPNQHIHDKSLLSCQSYHSRQSVYHLLGFLHERLKSLTKARRVPLGAQNRIECMFHILMKDVLHAKPVSSSIVQSAESLVSLNNELMNILHERLVIRKSELDRKNRLFEIVDAKIREVYHTAGYRFGSAENGFQICNSDTDVIILLPETARRALRLEANQIDKDVRPNICVLACRKLAKELSSFQNVSMNIVENARVPLLRIQAYDLECQLDVSFNNRLGLRNTALLRAYSESDPRAMILGILIKHWAKQRQLANAYSGTLSSYAWVLLVIYFLQRTSPPILPCLQLPPASAAQEISGLPFPELLEDDADAQVDEAVGKKLHNVWYREPTELYDREGDCTNDILRKDWESYASPKWKTAERIVVTHRDRRPRMRENLLETPTNDSTIGELLHGFFKFFAFNFNFMRNVVSIRVAQPSVSKEELFHLVAPGDSRQPRCVVPSTQSVERQRGGSMPMMRGVEDIIPMDNPKDVGDILPPIGTSHTYRRTSMPDLLKNSDIMPSDVRNANGREGEERSHPFTSPVTTHSDRSIQGGGILHDTRLQQTATSHHSSGTMNSASVNGICHHSMIKDTKDEVPPEAASWNTASTSDDEFAATTHTAASDTGRDSKSGDECKKARSTINGYPWHDFSKMQTSARLPLLTLEDPFENGRTLAPSLRGMERIAYELRRAAFLLFKGEPFHLVASTLKSNGTLNDHHETEMTWFPIPPLQQWNRTSVAQVFLKPNKDAMKIKNRKPIKGIKSVIDAIPLTTNRTESTGGRNRSWTDLSIDTLRHSSNKMRRTRKCTDFESWQTGADRWTNGQSSRERSQMPPQLGPRQFPLPHIQQQKRRSSVRSEGCGTSEKNYNLTSTGLHDSRTGYHLRKLQQHNPFINKGRHSYLYSGGGGDSIDNSANAIRDSSGVNESSSGHLKHSSNHRSSNHRTTGDSSSHPISEDSSQTAKIPLRTNNGGAAPHGTAATPTAILLKRRGGTSGGYPKVDEGGLDVIHKPQNNIDSSNPTSSAAAGRPQQSSASEIGTRIIAKSATAESDPYLIPYSESQMTAAAVNGHFPTDHTPQQHLSIEHRLRSVGGGYGGQRDSRKFQHRTPSNKRTTPNGTVAQTTGNGLNGIFTSAVHLENRVAVNSAEIVQPQIVGSPMDQLGLNPGQMLLSVLKKDRPRVDSPDPAILHVVHQDSYTVSRKHYVTNGQRTGIFYGDPFGGDKALNHMNHSRDPVNPSKHSSFMYSEFVERFHGGRRLPRGGL